MTGDMCEQIKAYKEQFPYITGKKIYEKMIQEGYLKEHEISMDSIYRFLKNEHLTRNNMPPVECLAFEMEHANLVYDAYRIVEKKDTYACEVIPEMCLYE